MSDEKRVGVGFGVLVLKNKKILLGKRNDDPEKASSLMHGEGTWTMPGGKFEFGEELEEGAIRELAEETGLKARRKDLKLISISNDRVSDAHFVTLGFLCEKFKGEPRVTEPDEIIEWQWFDLKKLPEKVFPPSKKVLKSYLAGKIYKN